MVKTIRMTLTGPYKGKTCELNGVVFVDGIADFTGDEVDCKGISTYFIRSYQVKISEPTEEDQVAAEEAKQEAIREAAEAEEAARVAAEARLRAEQERSEAEIAEAAAKEAEAAAAKEAEEAEEAAKKAAELNEPNERQAAIIAAINGVEKKDWVDKHATAHPKVKDVQTLMEDPTVNKAEIVEVIETWLE
jgi:hypothetical protein